MAHERPATELVAEYLALTHRDVVFAERWAGWKPGDEWDLARVAPLMPRALSRRCRQTPSGMQASFASICDRGP